MLLLLLQNLDARKVQRDKPWRRPVNLAERDLLNREAYPPIWRAMLAQVNRFVRK
jgi:hypothetical protein